MDYSVVNTDQFYEYLRNKGFNETGANEIIKRFQENRPDELDLFQIRLYQEQNHT